jgi:hypothetical protein
MGSSWKIRTCGVETLIGSAIGVIDCASGVYEGGGEGDAGLAGDRLRAASSRATVSVFSATAEKAPSTAWCALPGGLSSGLSIGLLEESKLMILILGMRISGITAAEVTPMESASMALAVRFRFRGVEEDDVGEDDDMTLARTGQQRSNSERKTCRLKMTSAMHTPTRVFQKQQQEQNCPNLPGDLSSASGQSLGNSISSGVAMPTK